MEYDSSASQNLNLDLDLSGNSSLDLDLDGVDLDEIVDELGEVDIDLTETVVCPHCNTANEVMRSVLGLTAEVSIFDGPSCTDCGYPLGESMDGS